MTTPEESNLNSGQPPAKPPTPVSKTGEIISFCKTLLIFLAVVYVLRASVVEAFKIPSGSMIPTLRIGDHILVSKLSYGLRLPLYQRFVFQWQMPSRGDIVVFTQKEDPSTNFIKRVIGLPGEIVEVRGSRVYINNRLVPENYARWEEGGLSEGSFGPEQVPPGHTFLLGDNRDHSRDSRFWANPFLDMQRVKGRAWVIYWSWDPAWSERMFKLIR